MNRKDISVIPADEFERRSAGNPTMLHESPWVVVVPVSPLGVNTYFMY